MAYRDPAVRRRRDRARFRKRTAERVAQGLCPRCGDGPPAPERSVCDPCAEKRNKASRVRDARLRAEGRPRRDPAKARACERKRSRRETAARIAEGTCTRCGKAPAAPGRVSCEPCLEKRRADDRARYARGQGSGEALRRREPGSQTARAARTESKRSARRRGARPACASAAAGIRRSRAGRPARRAATSARRRNGSNMTNGGPPVSAPAAAGRSSTACRAAAPAPRSTRPATRPSARTPAAASST